MAQILTTNKRYYLGANVDKPGVIGPAGIYGIGIQGSFNGCSVSLQWSINKGTTWTDNSTSTVFTANGNDVFYVMRPDECLWSLNVTDGSAPDMDYVVGQCMARN